MTTELTWDLYDDGRIEVRHPALGTLEGTPEDMVTLFDGGLNVAQQAMEDWAAHQAETEAEP